MSQQSKSIKQFCAENQISKATFYRHKERMPRVVKIGHSSRILISDAMAWERQMQQEADKNRAF